MLHTENKITIDAPSALIYELASDIMRWPELLAHYRYVHVLECIGSDERVQARRVKMAASRSGIPISWTSIQLLHPDDLRIVYHHIRGLTRGMDVVWKIVDLGDKTKVTIDHDLDLPRWLRLPLSRFIVGQFFISSVASKTLQGIKQQAEDRARQMGQR